MKKIILSLYIFLILTGCKQQNNDNQTTNTKADSFAVFVKDSIRKEKIITIPHEETEEEETNRVAKEKYDDDIEEYNALGMYDGKFYLDTESENANGHLTLKYLGDKEFEFTLDLMVPAICNGEIKGSIFMDRTQHGFYRENGCYLHFNFMGNWADYGLIVEVEQEEKCDKMKGDCIFTGKYVSKLKQ